MSAMKKSLLCQHEELVSASNIQTFEQKLLEDLDLTEHQPDVGNHWKNISALLRNFVQISRGGASMIGGTCSSVSSIFDLRWQRSLKVSSIHSLIVLPVSASPPELLVYPPREHQRAHSSHRLGLISTGLRRVHGTDRTFCIFDLRWSHSELSVRILNWTLNATASRWAELPHGESYLIHQQLFTENQKRPAESSGLEETLKNNIEYFWFWFWCKYEVTTRYMNISLILDTLQSADLCTAGGNKKISTWTWRSVFETWFTLWTSKPEQNIPAKVENIDGAERSEVIDSHCCYLSTSWFPCQPPIKCLHNIPHTM